MISKVGALVYMYTQQPQLVAVCNKASDVINTCEGAYRIGELELGLAVIFNNPVQYARVK